MESGWVFTLVERTAVERGGDGLTSAARRVSDSSVSAMKHTPAAKLLCALEVGLTQSLSLWVTRGEAKPTSPL